MSDKESKNLKDEIFDGFADSEESPATEKADNKEESETTSEQKSDTARENQDMSDDVMDNQEDDVVVGVSKPKADYKALFEEHKKKVFMALGVILALLLISFGVSTVSQMDFDSPDMLAADGAANSMQFDENESFVAQATQKVSDKPSGLNVDSAALQDLLLKAYPTKEEMRKAISEIRGADVSPEELNVFLLAVKNNADAIRDLQRKSNTQQSTDAGELRALRSALADLNNTNKQIVDAVNTLQKNMEELRADVDKLKKNDGWYHNRITKLEGGKVVGNTKPKQVQKTEVKKLTLNKQSDWMVNGASENVAFITNKKTKERLRVSIGYDIQGCGVVTEISSIRQQVKTTSCIIEN